MNKAVLNSASVARALHAAFCRDASRQELLQLAATKIRASGSPYTGVYMYMLNDSNELVLEAFDGTPTEHDRILVGQGICGRAVQEGRDLNIRDVSADSGYLACSTETQSELVVLIRRNDDVLGQIDVDSDEPAGFDDAEETAVRKVADALATLL